MKIIIFDFEVFKYDTLLGAFILNDGEVELFQTWDLDEIKKFYEQNTESIWIGHNNTRYDNMILQAIVKGENPKKVSDDIIVRNIKKYLNIPLYYYDLYNELHVGLKITEAFAGKKISMTTVDFNLDRPLTDDEKKRTEDYNYDDLDQTLDNFIEMYDTFELRLNLLAEYGFPLDDLPISGTRIAGKVLGAKKIWGIEKQKVKPHLYDNLKLENQDLIDYYMNETFKSRKQLKITLCDLEHKIGLGGIHAARPKYMADNLMYFDVSGYYNTIMINYKLLSRALPPESQKLYEKMFVDQKELKVTNPKKRVIYKVVLLSVFGATYNKWTDFYDPEHYELISLTGQLFLTDLLEKLEGKIELVQSNTDGIIARPLVETKEIEAILKEWEDRTGFFLDLDYIDKLIQRDVNNYIMLKDEKVIVKGEAVKNYHAKKSVYWYGSYNATEPMIFDNCIVDYYLYDTMPEETIEKYMRELTMFQYISKKNTFDRLELESEENGVITSEVVENITRSFASNDKQVKRMLYKCRDNGKVKRAKVASLPDNIFVYNEEVKSEEAVKYLMERINYDYYVKRAYERIAEFMYIPKLKQLKF